MFKGLVINSEKLYETSREQNCGRKKKNWHKSNQQMAEFCCNPLSADSAVIIITFNNV